MPHPLVREALNVFVVFFLVFLLEILFSCIKPQDTQPNMCHSKTSLSKSMNSCRIFLPQTLCSFRDV